MKQIFCIVSILFLNLMIPKRSFSQKDDFVIKKNQEVRVEGKDGISIVANDIYSMRDKLKRSIRIYDGKNGVLIGEAFISLQSNSRDENMYDIIKERPESFSGVITIEIDGNIVYTKTILNGKESFAGRLYGGGVPGPIYNPHVPCTVRTVHDCVAYNIEGMNWIQYAICLVGAPICYAEQWASCTWEVCRRHMQYTNPN